MTAGCLLDTNVLLYLVNPAAPEHRAAKAAVADLLAAGERLAIAAQVLFEFWSVATRPGGVNGLGWPVARARAEVDAIRQDSSCWKSLRPWSISGSRSSPHSS